MTPERSNRFWLLMTFLLILVIITSSLVIWIRHDNGQPLVIAALPTPQASNNSEITSSSPQKIDINRADIWLLQALPNIGEVRAKAIVDYRLQNGPYHAIEDLTKVPGVSISTFEKIKNLITVSE